jgi:hypothetical protein
MSVEEIGVASVDVGGFHVDEIPDELVRWVHALLEEGDNNSVELLLEHGIAAEELLVQELAEDADKFVIDQ